MVGGGSRAAEGEEEAGLFVMGGAAAADLLAQGFELDVDLMLLGEGAQLHEQLGGVDDVNAEHAEEKADDEGKRKIFRKPVQRAEYVGTPK